MHINVYLCYGNVEMIILLFVWYLAEDNISGNGIPEDPSSQPPQTPSNTVKSETPPVSPTGAQTQPTSKSKAQEPCKY